MSCFLQLTGSGLCFQAVSFGDQGLVPRPVRWRRGRPLTLRYGEDSSGRLKHRYPPPEKFSHSRVHCFLYPGP